MQHTFDSPWSPSKVTNRLIAVLASLQGPSAVCIRYTVLDLGKGKRVIVVVCAIRHLNGLSELSLNSNPLVSNSERSVAMGSWT